MFDKLLDTLLTYKGFLGSSSQRIEDLLGAFLGLNLIRRLLDQLI